MSRQMSRQHARQSAQKEISERERELDLIESSPEVKSYIYQQLADFQPFVTSNTQVYVIARNPDEVSEDAIVAGDINPEAKHRIAIILKEGDTTLEAEAYSDDIYKAIRLAKESLIETLSDIEHEVHEPNERPEEIDDSAGSNQLH